MENEKFPYENHFTVPIWFRKLGLFAKISEQINILYNNVQGREVNIIKARDKIKEFIRNKIMLDFIWRKSVGFFPMD